VKNENGLRIVEVAMSLLSNCLKPEIPVFRHSIARLRIPSRPNSLHFNPLPLHGCEARLPAHRHDLAEGVQGDAPVPLRGGGGHPQGYSA